MSTGIGARPALTAMATAGAVVLAGGPAAAQAVAPPSSVEQLRQELEQRDQIIADLLRRVQQLEQAQGVEPPPPGAAPPPPEAAPPEAPAAEPEQPGPGQVIVEEEEIDRALERSLVQAGALLLAPGSLEVEPSFFFARTEDDFATGVPVGGGAVAVGEVEDRLNEFEGTLTFRLGLPFDSQIDLDVPYAWNDLSTTTSIDGGLVSEDAGGGNGFGDVLLTGSKTFLREGAFRPSLIGSVTWDSNTGEEEGGVALGSGFTEISGALTATKTLDPLVFVGSFSYGSTFEEDDVDPGDEVGLSFGAVLATSPETSLSAFVSQSFQKEAEIGGVALDGSDDLEATLTLGAATIIAPRTLLSIDAGVGLTDDAADYSVLVSLPIRFDTGFLR